MTDRNYFLLGVLMYALSTIYSIFLWRKGFRRDDFANYLLLTVGFILHTTAIFMRGHDLRHCPVYNTYEACTFFTWFLLLAYLFIGLWHRFRFLGAFVAPVMLCVGVFALMPKLDPPHGPAPQFTEGLPSTHAALSLLAYAAFGLSCAAGLMLLTQEKNLKQHKANALLSLLPPMQRLEDSVTRLMLVGFTLLTAGLATGTIYLRENADLFQPRGDLKIIWSIVVWFLYNGLLLARWKSILRGRRLALCAIISFIFVVLTFWGTNLLSPIHNR